MDLDFLVAPRSVAIIGASARPGSLGHTTMQNVINSGIERIYPIHPNETEILGYKAYRTIAEVPEEIDLALIGIAARSCPQAVQECIAKGVKAAFIFAAGFEEAGEQGAVLQREILSSLSGSTMRLLGPNCTGVYNANRGINLTLSPTLEAIRPSIKPGSLGFISQSGSYGVGLFIWGVEQGIHFSKFFSIGNKIDLDENDLLEYLGQDADTRVIMLYLEEIRQGRRFMELAKRISAEKPIVALKIGRTSTGARASASHTGALVGSYQVYQAAFKQCGVINVGSSRELLDVAKGLSLQPPLKGKRIGLVTDSGAQGAELSDMLDEYGLEVPALSPPLQQKLYAEEAIPPYGSAANPVDVGAADPRYREWYFRSAKILLESDEIDGVILIMIGAAMEMAGARLIEGIEELRRPGKPLVVSGLAPEWSTREWVPKLQAASIPVYDDCAAVARCMAALYEYGRYLEG